MLSVFHWFTQKSVSHLSSERDPVLVGECTSKIIIEIDYSMSIKRIKSFTRTAFLDFRGNLVKIRSDMNYSSHSSCIPHVSPSTTGS